MNDSAHRLWPPPREPWLMRQTWHDLLFAHWPIALPELRPLVPAGLQVDLHEGQAWIGVVPFWMSGIRRRWWPPLPGLTGFPEINVRTYVTRDGKPGVYFFSLDAAHRFAVAAARRWYYLNYFYARVAARHEDGWVRYRSARTERAAPAAEFRARYRPAGQVIFAQRGGLPHWLTERYCLYAADGQGRIYRGEIHHAPWPLQAAEAEIEANTMAQPLGLPLSKTPPLLHFAKRMETVVWPVEVLEGERSKADRSC